MFRSINSSGVNRLLNIIEKNKSGLGGSLEKIASGRRLNRAGEDPASNAIATQLRSDIRALSQATRNVDAGLNFIRSAEGGLSSISDLVARGRELALQAANGTLGDSERQTLNAEFSQIKSEIDRISASSEFNGQKLLDGSLSPQSATQIDIQAGIGSGPENQINLNVVASTDTQSLGIGATDLSTADGARQALGDLDQAAARLNATRGQVGAVANRLAITSNGLGSTIENLTRSESALADTDLAREISNLQRGLALTKISLKTLAVSLQQNERTTGRLINFQV
ncbi:MAG: flagellin FliC [Nitrospinae bacterium]|nr:flagellin FliC [Nitrospinota bacterium]